MNLLLEVAVSHSLHSTCAEYPTAYMDKRSYSSRQDACQADHGRAASRCSVRRHEIRAFARALRSSKAKHSSCLILARPAFPHLLHPVARFLEARQWEARAL